MREPIVRVLVLSWLLLSTACVEPLQQWGEETTFHPKAASFDPSTLKLEQVAILSAMVGFGLEGYAHQMSRSLASALNQTRIPIKSLTVHDTSNRINREGLTGEYAGMVSDYVRTGILDRAGLEKWDEHCISPLYFSPAWPRSANPCPAAFRTSVFGSCKPASQPSV